jgi:MFS family permease
LQSPPQKEQKERWVYIVGLIVLLFTIIEAGIFLSDDPKTRIFEANICVHHYKQKDPSAIDSHGTVPEAECKIIAIQQKLAMIIGWQDTFDAIPGLLMAVPLGALADRRGRICIFILSLVGLQLSSAWVLMICYFRELPLQWTWLSSAFSLIGGGSVVAVAMGPTMISDVTPPEKRTHIFLCITAAMVLSEMIAPILASRLMRNGNWPPLLLAFVIQQLGVSIVLFCPETIHTRSPLEPRADDTEGDVEVVQEEPEFGFKAQLGYYKDALVFLRSKPTLMLILFSYLGNRSGRQALQLLVRYASKRYKWEIKEAALLSSFRAATNLLSVAVVLPGFNYVLLDYFRLPLQRADVWLARGSIILFALSFFIMGVAYKPALLLLGLIVYNLGTGHTPAIRSIAIHVIGGQTSPNISKLISLLAITESIGFMISGPLVNKLFNWGMDMGPLWLGLPFLGTSVLYGILTVVIFGIDVKDGDVQCIQVARAGDKGTEFASESSSSLDARSNPERRSTSAGYRREDRKAFDFDPAAERLVPRSSAPRRKKEW